MIRPEDFHNLPAWLPLATLHECGFTRRMVDFMAVRLQSARHKAPDNRIGYLQLAGKKRYFRRADLAVLLGPAYALPPARSNPSPNR